MWRALSVASGDLVAYLDSDTTDFDRCFICGLLGPILVDPSIAFLKATYSRPFKAPDESIIDDAGRVTELTAKPLFNVFYPELCGFGQPLSGELIASRELLRSIPFCTGYAVEAAMLIDVLRAVGLDAMAQVELGTRHNRYQSLFALGTMAYAVLRAVLMRAELERRAPAGDLDTYVHAHCPADGLRFDERLVRIVERPPMAEVLGE
jgi:glucosyl-3-phosphoglycerate synthase